MATKRVKGVLFNDNEQEGLRKLVEDPIRPIGNWCGKDTETLIRKLADLGAVEARTSANTHFSQPRIAELVQELDHEDPGQDSRIGKSHFPLEITESLRRFRKDHPKPRECAFIMMQFGTTAAHNAIVDAIRSAVEPYGIKALLANGKEYHNDLFPNVLTYLYGCGFGIAVFERLDNEVFNPNVSLEVGYMRALSKNICLLKDRTLRTLQTDLVGALYREFNPQNPMGTIPGELEKWLRDKDIITL